MESRRKTYNFSCNLIRRQLKKPMKKQNVFHMTYVPPISRLEPKKYVYLKLSDATSYIESKEAIRVLQITLRQQIINLIYLCN